MTAESVDARTASRWRRAVNVVRESLSSQQHDYTQGSMGRAVLLLAIPMMLEMAMESVFAIVDIFWVSSLGSDAVAVVGLTEAILTILYAVGIGLGMGATALVSRRIGENDPDGAAKVAGQSIWFGVAASVVVAIVGIVFAADLLRIMGAEPAVIETGIGYTRLMLGGSVTILLLFLLNSVLRGAGNAAFAMRVLWIANGINIVLGPCFIFGLGPLPELGVTGAAVATNIGRGIGVLCALYYLLNGRSRVVLRWPHLRVDFGVLLSLLRVSAGGVLQFIIATSSYIVLTRIVSQYGSAAIAGYTIAFRIMMFTFLPAWGLSNAAATLVGQNLGAGQPERAEESVWVATKFNVAFLVIVGLIGIVFAEGLVGLFSAEPDVLAYGAACLRIVSYGYGFYAVGMIMVQAFNGAGDTSTPTWLNLFCFWFLQLPLAYALATWLELGPDGVFWAVAIAESMLAVAAWVLFRRGRLEAQEWCNGRSACALRRWLELGVRHLPHREEEGRDDRADDDAGKPEPREPAERRQQYQIVRHARVAADQDRPQQIVDEPDHEHADQDQRDAGDDSAADDQDDRGRQPHERGADGGQDAQQRHQRSPEHGRAEPSNANAMPPIAPCTMPTTSVPLIVARDTCANRLMQQSLARVAERQRAHERLRASAAPSRRKKNNR